ncbi:MAG: glycerophosphodiester phosphodiesterase family protein [Flavobacterium sp.]
MKNKIIAHRGAWKEFNLPQNSVASLKKAIELKCFGSEFDVHLTKDLIAVVNHDADFFGLNIETTNYNDLLIKELPNGEKLPTLNDFYSVGLKQTETKLILEIKTSEIGGTDRTKQLIDVIVNELPTNANPENLEFILFDFDSAVYLKNKLPKFLVHYLEEDKTAYEIQKSGLNGIDYNYNLLLADKNMIKEFKNLNLKTNSWTVNNLEIAKEFISQEIDCITTDYPQLFLQNGL